MITLKINLKSIYTVNYNQHILQTHKTLRTDDVSFNDKMPHANEYSIKKLCETSIRNDRIS